MKTRIAILGLIAVLTLPALAVASAPVKGSEKQAIVTAVEEHLGGSATHRQIADCWAVRSYRSVWAVAQFHPAAGRFRECEPVGIDGGQMLHHTRAGWKVTLEFDDPVPCSYLRSHGMPVAAYNALAYAPCT